MTASLMEQGTKTQMLSTDVADATNKSMVLVLAPMSKTKV